MKQKVFCIGFHKTGTSSLADALGRLGYKVTGPNGTDDPDIKRNVYAMADALISQNDAFQDNPWPVIYQYLDQKYPESKFILTTRSNESWIQSVRIFGTDETPMRRWIYGKGCPVGNEEIYLRRYVDHNREVLEYFKDRPGDLLLMDLPSGDGWAKLCGFLGMDPPRESFPHVNKWPETLPRTPWNTAI